MDTPPTGSDRAALDRTSIDEGIWIILSRRSCGYRYAELAGEPARGLHSHHMTLILELDAAAVRAGIHALLPGRPLQSAEKAHQQDKPQHSCLGHCLLTVAGPKAPNVMIIATHSGRVRTIRHRRRLLGRSRGPHAL